MADELVESKVIRSHVLTSQCINPDTYEVNDRFQPSAPGDFWGAHTLHEMAAVLEKDPKVELDARILYGHEESLGLKKVSRETFLECLRGKSNSEPRSSFRESDLFLIDDVSSVNFGLVGDDFTPLLGGPFNKQLYLYDYLRMHAAAFFAFNHDPIARFIVTTTRDFTLGRGFRVDIRGKDKDKATVLWRAFEKANNLAMRFDQLAIESSLYGETMIWKLPNNATKIAYHVKPGQEPPKGLIPRIRLIDPSVIWDIMTYPEDIERPIYYQWMAPTQYNLYGAKDAGESVPTLKYIYQQIPADQVLHYKLNSVSNEKRGRSDLFPVLGYLKRLRDSVNYSIIAMQKNAAWSMDTTIDGAQSDLDAYVADQQALSTIPPAGSEFVHSTKIKREYLSNQGAGGRSFPSFEWCISMIASGVQIPTNYFGTHLSGGSTRASAIVATEPVAKKWEQRQLFYERIVHDLFDWLMEMFDLNADCEVTFPEVIVQDRSQKLKDLSLAQLEGWVSHQRASEISAKELGISEYDYLEEQDAIANEKPQVSQAGMNPLTAPPGVEQPEKPEQPEQPEQPAGSTSAITGNERADIKDDDYGS